jgi:uncharacterized protein YecE (DUF72 family)
LVVAKGQRHLGLHLGTIGWSYSFWKGPFYPAKTASNDFLAYYSSQFDTVEVDSTFYRIPSQSAVMNWRQQVPEGFLIALKFPQVITHIKSLKNCEADTAVFLSRAELLGDKLGPMLLQFPPNFTASHFSDLTDYLKALPKKHRYVVEVRNKSWLNPEFYALLRENKVALAITEKPLTSQFEVTADFLYMRWEGNRKTVNGLKGEIEVNQTEDLQAWAEKLKPYLERGVDVFGYFGKYYSGLPPSDVKALRGFLTAG